MLMSVDPTSMRAQKMTNLLVHHHGNSKNVLTNYGTYVCMSIAKSTYI